MSAPRMHADQVRTDAALVQRLLATQFPQWAALRVELVDSAGTDHDIYRLGDRLVARLPKVESATAQAAREARWLPWLAPQLPLALPVPVARGRPGAAYPFEWSVYEWLPGSNPDPTNTDLDQAAADLARFVTALRGVDTTGADPRPPGARGGPLAAYDDQVRSAIEQLGSRVDAVAARRAWQESVQAAGWTGPQVWVHADLLPGNLLVVDGRLSAVIDFGGLVVGDPACDLLPAWNMFEGSSRNRFRAELDVDEDSWLRGRGWTLVQAIVALPYYWHTNPGMARQALHALQQVLADRFHLPAGGCAP